VPAAAVIRGGRALFILNGRKGCVDYFLLKMVWESLSCDRMLNYIKKFEYITRYSEFKK